MDRNTVGLIGAVAAFLAYAVFVVVQYLPSAMSQGNRFGLSILVDGVILILLGYGVFYFWSVRKET